MEIMSENVIEKLPDSIEPGKHFYSLKLLELWDGSALRLPILIISGKKDGPTLCVVASIMGDEFPGTIAARKIALETDPEKLKGTLISIPIANPPSFGFGSHPPLHVSPLDYMNMNRIFPGRPDGYPSERIAYAIFEKIIRKMKTNYVVSFHGGGPYCEVYPATYFTETEVVEASMELALAFGVELNTKISKELLSTEEPGRVTGTLDACCGRHAIPAIIADIGGWGVLSNYGYSWAEIGYKGILNIMRYYGMIPGKAEFHPKAKIFDGRVWVRPNKGGFFEAKVNLGQDVSKGDILGIITDIFGRKKEELIAPKDGIVQLVRTYPVIGSGEEAFLIHYGGRLAKSLQGDCVLS
ncbi:MAG: succinylglutamate desuccinylase/aspartoacylase family protein [Candidatus Bathyarchaeia archaeon]|nr:succinylglutamate desuccinylase/aspartoacylase family protein [Candidatus Bathyarchaeota archaeon]